MNKRDFYKELMSEYMFDKDKICANAKKGKLAGRSPLPIYIGMTAAVAAAVVIVGSVVFTSFGRNGGVQISPDKPLAALSEKERLDRAIAEIQRTQDSTEHIDVYITFRTALSPKAAHSLLSKYSDGTVPVKMLYMADGSKAMGTNEVGSVFQSNNGEILAAVINCAGYKVAQINSDELVLLAEPMSENDNIADINPVSPEVDPPEIKPPVIEPPVPEDPDSGSDNSSSGNTHEPPDIDDPPIDVPGVDPGVGTSGTGEDPNSGSNSSDPDVSGGSGTSTSGPSISGDPATSGDTPVTPDPPPANVPGIPEGVKLPYTVESASFITDDLGAQKAYFLSENVFYVKSENAVSLYKWDGKKETLAVSQPITDAKVAWVSENGLRMMVSGTENGIRKKMFIIDAKNCTINDMHVENMVGEGSIAEAAYNESMDIFALNVFDVDYRYIYTAKLSGYHPSNEQIIAYGSENLSLLGAYNGVVYYSDTAKSSTAIYKCEKGENFEVKLLDSVYVSTLNSAFTHALVVGSNGLYIFDPASESLIPADVDKATFGASAHSFSDGKSYFTVSAGAIVPEGGISAIAKIDFTRSFSTKWAALVSNGSVRIVPSAYTERVKTDGITFAQPVENASAEQRAVVNSAVGVINALANGSCKECGLDTSEKLQSVIDAFFSSNEAKYVKALCEVSQSGELKYSNGGLCVVNVSDTVLVMDGDLNGTLYIKAGTFDGKTAYRTVPITLITENGRLLMDSVV